MSTQYNAKPESALKRAEELVALGYKQKALETLYAVVANRRHRQWTKATEKMTLRFLDLCVELRKSDMAKEGLFQYRVTSVQVPNSLELVIKHFLQRARDAATDAQQKALAAGAAIEPEDFDVEDFSADQLLLVSGEGSKERNERIVDREIVIPWLRFLWDTYRTVLDTLRNISKLELLYKSTAEQAFDFCLSHKRTMEFRRLSELFKGHMVYLKSNSAAQLDNPESFQIQLEIRLMQLNTAASLELWQEAFRTVEEINGMVAPPKRVPPVSMMIPYYEKLAKIFWVSENYVFHCHALSKYHQLLHEFKITRENEPAVAPVASQTTSDSSIQSLADSTDQIHAAAVAAEHQRKLAIEAGLLNFDQNALSTQVLLAALSLPVPSGVSSHRSVQLKTARQHVPLSIMLLQEKQNATTAEVNVDSLLSESESSQAERIARAASIYGFHDLDVDRESVMRELASRSDILANVVPELAGLYDLLETSFKPLQLGKTIQSKLAYIESVPAYKPYSKTISQLAFLRIIQQIGTVYQTLRLKKLEELVPFLPKEVLEKWTVKAIREKYIEAKIDHKHGLIIFQTTLSGAATAASSISSHLAASLGVSSNVLASNSTIGTCSSFESHRVRHRLSEVSRDLSQAVQVILAPHKQARQEQKKAAFVTIAVELEKEHQRILKRREIIEQSNIAREQRVAAAAREKAAAERAERERLLAEAKEAQAARARAAAEKIAQAKQAEIELQQKSAVIQKLGETAEKRKAKLSGAAQKKLESGAMDTQDFIETQVKAIVAGQERTERHLRELTDRMDHLARAKREAELPLLRDAAKTRGELEAQYIKAARDHMIEEHRKNWEKLTQDKKRLAKAQAARKALEERVLEARRKVWAEQQAVIKARQAEIERERREAEERERKIRAEEQAKREAELAAKREREAEAQRLQEEREQQQGGTKLNWAAQKALEAGGSLTRPAGGVASGSSAGAYRPPARRSEAEAPARSDDNWKKSDSSAPKPSAGAYRPPARRGGGDKW